MIDGKKKIDCVLFDLDGTLIDSMGDLVAALSQYLESLGVYSFQPESAYQVSVHSANSFLELCLGREPTTSELEEFIALYADMPRTHTYEYLKVDELLTTLNNNGIPWGIVTNKPKAIAEEEIIKIGYDIKSVACIYGDTLAVKKPDPAPLLLAANKANIDATKCVYIGDSASDIDAGINAGMLTIAVTYGYGNIDKLRHADYRVDSVKELQKLLSNLTSYSTG